MSYTNFAKVRGDGSIDGPIVIGDDYLTANGRGFVWEIDAIPGVSLGTATCWFVASNRGDGWNRQGVITNLGGGKWQLAFELTSPNTSGLNPGTYRWHVEIRDGVTDITRVIGQNNLRLIEITDSDSLLTPGRSIDCGFPESVFDPNGLGTHFDGGSP